LLACFAGNGVLGAWQAARWLGVVSWILAAGWLGWDLQGRRRALWIMSLLAVSAPVGAWASAGMETGIVIALVTLSTSRSPWSTLPAALAAAWRPELIPFAFVLALGRATSIRRTWCLGLVAIIPAASVATLRCHYFGSAYPLAVVAKPSDLSFGLLYLSQTLLLGGPFWLWLGPGWRKLERAERALSLAIVAHLAAVTLAGGDWMVLLRLAAPVFPAALRIAVLLNEQRKTAWALPAWVCAGAATAYLGLATGRPGRHIAQQRTALIESARPKLSGAKVVATLDVGWLGAAHAQTVIDFAGVTLPAVAHLAGGHTTKRIDSALLRSRNVDRVVLLLAPNAAVEPVWEESHFARGVEVRAARLAAELGCVPDGTVALSFTQQRYLFVRCPDSAQ
jgi:hypothetical protein